MTIVAEEYFRSRRGDAFSEREREYLVTGTGPDADLDEHNAILAAVAVSPLTVTGTDGLLGRTNATISHVLSNSQMIITVQYGEAGGASLAVARHDAIEYEFQYQAPSVTVKQALETFGVWSAVGQISPPAAPLFRGAIGVSQDDDNKKDIEGVQTTPATTNTWNLTVSSISSAYESTVEGLMGGVNHAPWRGRAAGTMRLVSASSQQTLGQPKATIRFGFHYEPHQTNIVITSLLGDITVTSKRGHDYLWVYYEKADGGPNLGLVPAAKYAIVDRIYPYVNMSFLGF